LASISLYDLVTIIQNASCDGRIKTNKMLRYYGTQVIDKTCYWFFENTEIYVEFDIRKFMLSNRCVAKKGLSPPTEEVK
jgi:hypothetical protein